MVYGALGVVSSSRRLPRCHSSEMWVDCWGERILPVADAEVGLVPGQPRNVPGALRVSGRTALRA